MRVDEIRTDAFRLLKQQTIAFDPGVNVICGENAQGKTTLLEAVYLLTGAKSFRTRLDRELIAFGEESALLQGRLNACGRDQTVDILLARGRSRRMKVNGAKRKSADMTENLTAVIFSPDDLQLVRGAASLRRHMMDMAICQLRPGYRRILADFNELYENKTRILRDWREKPSLLEPLDEFSAALCRCSAGIIRYRASFTDRLAAAAAPIHADFSGGREQISLQYQTVSTVTDAKADERTICEQLLQRQAELRQAELDAGQCLVGAHKDELAIFINGVDARVFASQGQTRTAALSLKLAERELFLQETGESPVLLLDDVLSELDAARQEFVLNRIGSGQTLITCCSEDSVRRLTGGRVLRLEGGLVR